MRPSSLLCWVICGSFVFILAIHSLSSYLRWTSLVLKTYIERSKIEPKVFSHNTNILHAPGPPIPFGRHSESLQTLAAAADLRPEVAALLQRLSDKITRGELSDAVIREHWPDDDSVWSAKTTGLDVLNDRCELTGFPSEALTVDTARLCDASRHVQLRRGFTCEGDPSCRKCTSRSMKRYGELRSAFREKAFERRRLEQIERHFDKGSLVVVSAVNSGMLYLFFNWACSCEALGIDPRKIVYLIPSDRNAHAVLKEKGFIVPEQYLDVSIRENYEGRANYGGHSDINTLLMFATIDLVRLGYYTLLQDVDMSWAADPREYLMNAVKTRDLVAMIAPRGDAHGPINSGFIFIAPTQKSTVLMDTLENLGALKGNSDQVLWNSVIRIPEFAQLEWRLLPYHLFRKTGMSSAWNVKSKSCANQQLVSPPREYFVLHAVGNDKKNRLQKHGQWHFAESCTFYTRNVTIT